MKDNNIIQIFLASSIKEFEREREQLELFIRNVSDKFEEKYNVKIRIILCENIDPAYTIERKQEEYNQIIRNCNMVFFIFFTKLGEFTHEEFIVAQKNFKECGLPKIYTYFKNLSSTESMEQPLSDFMDWLDNTLGHYHTTFDHLDTIKLRMLLNIYNDEIDFLKGYVKNGEYCIDNIPILSLEHVSEFYNNIYLQELLEAYKKKKAECNRLKERVNAEALPELWQEYTRACTERETLSQNIHKLQEKILRITLNMCNSQSKGEITQRQKIAYHLFEQGDLEGCMRILHPEDIDREYLAGESMLEELVKENATKYICEHMTAIEILSSMINNPNRFKEISERFEKIIPIAKKYFIKKEIFLEYCNFLLDSGESLSAKKFIEDLINFYEENNKNFSDQEITRLYEAYGDVLSKICIYGEAKRAYRKALKKLKNNTEENVYKVYLTEKLTQSILAIGRNYQSAYKHSHGNSMFYLNPINLLYSCVQKNCIRRLDKASADLLEIEMSDANRLLRAKVHYNYARYYENHNKKRCQEHYLKALDIAEKCDDSNDFTEKCLQAFVIFLWRKSKSVDVSTYLNRLIQIRETQFDNNPEKYFYALYVTYLIACYTYLKKDKALYDIYAEKLLKIVSTFKQRMKLLADADVNSYMRFSDGTFDWFLNNFAHEYPELIELISDIFFSFNFHKPRWLFK